MCSMKHEACLALIQFLRADVDFQGVLQDKNATASLKQIIEN